MTRPSSTPSSTPEFGTRLANRVALVIGSWRFLIIQSLFLLFWLLWNTIQGLPHWDNPQLTIENLLLSFQAAYTGPILLIAANAAAKHDRMQADHDSAILAKIARLEERELLQLGIPESSL